MLRDATSSRSAGGGAAPRGIADGGTPEALPEGESRVIAVVVVVGGVASVSVLDLRGQHRSGEGRTAGGVGEDAEEEGCIQYQDSCSELQRRLPAKSNFDDAADVLSGAVHVLMSGVHHPKPVNRITDECNQSATVKRKLKNIMLQSIQCCYDQWIKF